MTSHSPEGQQGRDPSRTGDHDVDNFIAVKSNWQVVIGKSSKPKSYFVYFLSERSDLEGNLAKALANLYSN